MLHPRTRILAIDDTPANLMSLGAVLDGEFELQFATSGQAGIALALAHPPDLILLDVMMPEVDGFETFRRLSVQTTLKNIPVIFVTALNDFDSEVTSLTLGAADFIAKPVNVTIARHRIRNLIEREGLRKGVELQHQRLEALRAEAQAEESRQRLRDLAIQNERAREEERKHVAHELHDELGQLLTALKMALQLMEMRFCPHDPALSEVVSQARGLLDRAIHGTRDVVSRLRPAALDLGLVPCLEWLCQEFSRQTGVPCRFDAANECVHLDEACSIVVFRIAQESLTNITRYAQASRVDISIGQSGGETRLEIRDNGKGFDVAATRQKKTFGLLGMRERAKALGGRVEIESAAGSGATIRLMIPVDAGATKETP